LRIILTDPNVKAVLFNIFGGITRCDEVAKGILAALEELAQADSVSPALQTDRRPSRGQVPMVARLVGTNEEEGRQILADADMITAATLAEAAQKAVAAARGEL
jgi:succinyl-CoA synthetase beta subunit